MCFSLKATLTISSPNKSSTILGFLMESSEPWPKHPSMPLPEKISVQKALYLKIIEEVSFNIMSEEDNFCLNKNCRKVPNSKKSNAIF